MGNGELQQKLRRLGLSEYEARAYLALLGEHIATAARISAKSGVPRTKIYSVLEELSGKGWVKLFSGVPILFKATEPPKVFERMRREHEEFLESVEKTLHKEAPGMEKYVIKRMNIALETLKGDIRKAKTVTMSNATAEMVKKLADSFAPDAHVRVLLFPGEKPPKDIEHRNLTFKSAEMRIVCINGNKEVPSVSLILDEARTFTIIPDTSGRKLLIEEMVYDECSKCFNEWTALGWGAADEK